MRLLFALIHLAWLPNEAQIHFIGSSQLWFISLNFVLKNLSFALSEQKKQT